MNLLELTQAVAFKSRTVPGQGRPAALAGISGRQARCLDAVQQAWREIQTRRADWQWMRREFTGAALDGVTQFEPTDWVATRFRSWRVASGYGRDCGWTIYKTADGTADERPLFFQPWEMFRAMYLRGEYEPDYPQMFSIDPQKRVRLHPVPLGDYTVRGEYQRSPQTLVDGTDTPELPETWHDLIWLKALLILNEGDESAYLEPRTRERVREHLAELEAAELPQIAIGGRWSGGGPLA